MAGKEKSFGQRFWGQAAYDYQLPVWDKFGNQAGPDSAPEVTIYPNPRDLNTGTLMREAVPDKEIRNQFYDWITNNGGRYEGEVSSSLSDNDRADRFLNLYNNAQRPTIKKLTPEEADIGYRDNGDLRSYYIGVGNDNDYVNTIYAAPQRNWKYDSAIMAELAHSYQYFDPDSNKHWTTPSWDKIQSQHAFGNDNEDSNGLTGYDRLGNIEYNAHRIIQPAQESYVLGLKEDYLNGKPMENFSEGLQHYTDQAVSEFRKRFPNNEDPYSSFKLTDEDKNVMSKAGVSTEDKYATPVKHVDNQALGRMGFATKANFDEIMKKLSNSNLMLGKKMGGKLLPPWHK